MLLGLFAKIKVLDVLPAYLSLVFDAAMEIFLPRGISLDAGTVLESIQTLSTAGFVCCHCAGRWAV